MLARSVIIRGGGNWRTRGKPPTLDNWLTSYENINNTLMYEKTLCLLMVVLSFSVVHYMTLSCVISPHFAESMDVQFVMVHLVHKFLHFAYCSKVLDLSLCN